MSDGSDQFEGVSCRSSKSADDGGDDAFGAPVDEAFGVAGGEFAELFGPGEASLVTLRLRETLRSKCGGRPPREPLARGG